MSELSDKILNILLENNVKPENISQTLYGIHDEIENRLWEKINISPLAFYNLKDTIFYNFEYRYYNDNPTGKSNLKNYGKNYPLLMIGINGSTYINNDSIDLILNELTDIKTKWNENIFFTELYARTEFDWAIGDNNSSKLIIYNKETETPMTHGLYSNNYSNIYDVQGNNIKSDDNVVLCSIRKIDLYREYNLLTQTLNNLYNIIKKASENKKGVYINFDDQNYL